MPQCRVMTRPPGKAFLEHAATVVSLGAVLANKLHYDAATGQAVTLKPSTGFIAVLLLLGSGVGSGLGSRLGLYDCHASFGRPARRVWCPICHLAMCAPFCTCPCVSHHLHSPHLLRPRLQPRFTLRSL